MIVNYFENNQKFTSILNNVKHLNIWLLRKAWDFAIKSFKF